MLTNPAFIYSTQPPKNFRGNAYWFLFHDNKLLTYKSELNKRKPVPFCLSIDEFDFEVKAKVHVGTYHDYPCFALSLENSSHIPDCFQPLTLRESLCHLSDDLFWVGNTAQQILRWDLDHQFCSRCGSKTAVSNNERAKKCPNCGLTTYPRILPAIIVLITRGDEVLLARSPHFPQGRYACIAGFIEAGESAEQAVHREVAEEVGLKVNNIQYFGSQSWPPSSLMIGYTADCASGEIKIDGIEIEDAKWFKRDSIPDNLPLPASISRRLIDSFLFQQS